MSCLRINVKIAGRSPSVNVDRIGDGLHAVAHRVDKPLECNVNDVLQNKHLRICCGLVCSFGGERYINVSPTEVQWITPDMSILYMVESNVDWVIVTN